MTHLGGEERRRRLAVRHGLHPRHRHADPLASARTLAALHATDASTVYLTLAARVDGLSLDDVDEALYADRSLVRQLAMRRTLWVIPRDDLPAVRGSAAARVAGQEERRLAGDVERSGITRDGQAWLEEVAGRVREVLAGQDPLTSTELRDHVPELDARVSQGSGAWVSQAPAATRVLTWLGARGDVMRAQTPFTGRPRWTTPDRWLGTVPPPLRVDEGYAVLVRHYLRAFGPATEDDVVWWLGATKTAVRRALAELGAVQVRLDEGAGWVLPDDTEPTPDPGPWAALLPTLDPTMMGWKGRDFYLDPSIRPYVIDSAGNATTTAWWCGRVVGSWVQDDDATVLVLPRADLTSQALAALQEQAERLTAWLAGVVVPNVYAAKQAAGRELG
ncbi:winged helix DNA-binding domain-containing protein [Serinicoccus kebangsaanensis]|uniref:winged helix DNA-binding domain-containing protein n=1 Tax=Serinicoccus kebangsaanensis TaxID=2602069 RepID=UPI00124F6D82|nr:winged helix DNA-binding domain-containing protein [Serinicoccus kebangsaanensis]